MIDYEYECPNKPNNLKNPAQNLMPKLGWSYLLFQNFVIIENISQTSLRKSMNWWIL